MDSALPLALVSLVGGLFVVIKGADWLVDGASSIARKIGMSELAIGLTVVAFGTSLPELTVNIYSSIQGVTDIAIGNIVGSNIANILLILGIAALVAPLKVQTSTVWKEVPLSFLATLVLITMANDHLVDSYPLSELSRSDGLTLIAFFFVFLWYSFGIRNVDEIENDQAKNHGLAMSLLLLLGGVVLLTVGGKLTVNGAITLATALGLSEALVGLTVVAIGTSLPELATSVVAARRGKADIAVGNIVGSNIFNIFWILGVSAAISPLPFGSGMNVDVLVALLATVVLFFVIHTGHIGNRLFFFWRQKNGHVISKHEGGLLVALYVAYIVYLVWRG